MHRKDVPTKDQQNVQSHAMMMRIGEHQCRCVFDTMNRVIRWLVEDMLFGLSRHAFDKQGQVYNEYI